MHPQEAQDEKKPHLGGCGWIWSKEMAVKFHIMRFGAL
jgi:hypothetical protein